MSDMHNICDHNRDMSEINPFKKQERKTNRIGEAKDESPENLKSQYLDEHLNTDIDGYAFHLACEHCLKDFEFTKSLKSMIVDHLDMKVHEVNTRTGYAYNNVSFSIQKVLQLIECDRENSVAKKNVLKQSKQSRNGIDNLGGLLRMCNEMRYLSVDPLVSVTINNHNILRWIIIIPLPFILTKSLLVYFFIFFKYKIYF